MLVQHLFALFYLPTTRFIIQLLNENVATVIKQNLLHKGRHPIYFPGGYKLIDLLDFPLFIFNNPPDRNMTIGKWHWLIDN